MLSVLLALTCCLALLVAGNADASADASSGLPSWVLRTTEMPSGKLRQVSSHDKTLRHFLHMPVRGRGSDGENIDAILQFFFNLHDGIALELGAVTGTRKTYSETAMMEFIGWKRILVEGNPIFRKELAEQNSSFVANVVICDTPNEVHYYTADKYQGGVVEFMGEQTMKLPFMKWLYDLGTPKGNVSSVDFSNPAVEAQVQKVHCIPLKQVLKQAGVNHVNFFVLDVEGAEMSILHTIDWKAVRFDVIVVETEEAHRTPGFVKMVAAYLAERDYEHIFPDTPGRNSWFKHKDYVPTRNPKVPTGCMKGAAKASTIRGVKGFDYKTYMDTNCGGQK